MQNLYSWKLAVSRNRAGFPIGKKIAMLRM